MSDERIRDLAREALEFRYSRRQVLRRAAALGLSIPSISAILAACGGEGAPETDGGSESGTGQGSTDDQLTVWWYKGYYEQEDQALQAIAKAWEEESGIKVNLAFFTGEDLPQKTLSAVQSGTNVPDVAYANDWNIIPQLSWDGELVDVSDIIEPVKDIYTDAALQAARLRNNKADNRSYYAVPIRQQTIHIHYWRTLLEEIGLSSEDIPQEWDPFWAFWQDGQQQLRDKGHEDLYGIGFPMSTGATDTYFLFHQLLQAHKIRFMDDDGNLQFDSAAREGIAQVLAWEASLYKDGFVPPGAANWLDADNNANFINKVTLMTPNPSLSIPASQRDIDETIYFEQIGTQEFPSAPDGEPLTYMVSVKSAVILEKSKNHDTARDFINYLIKPKNLAEYLKGSLGRWYPVMPEILQDPYWAETEDPHIATANKQFSQATRPFQMLLNPAYSEALAENVWGNALGQIIIAGAKPEQAIDEAIKRIEQIFESWGKV